MSMRNHRRSSLILVAVLAAGALTACDPPPPRLQLVVDTTAGGADSDPGDGTCASAVAGGACTLQAAVEEGSAAVDGADVTVPAGDYLVHAQVTGDVTLKAGDTGSTNIDGVVAVSSGGFLRLDRINISTTEADPPSLRLLVHGSVILHRTWATSLTIGPNGMGVLAASVVGAADVDAPVVNSGRLTAISSSLIDDMQTIESAPALTTEAGGVTVLIGSVVGRSVLYAWSSPVLNLGMSGCEGEAPISGGYVHIEVPCGGEAGTGDSSGLARIFLQAQLYGTPNNPILSEFEHRVAPNSPLVDAIPMGQPGCDAGSVDLYGNPRGVDGDGDGVAGCDIGAVELQP